MGKNIEFDRIEVGNIETNLFNHSHSVVQSFKPGYIVPAMVKACMPGDIIGCKINSLCRMAPMLAPQFTMAEVKFEGFFVPHRLVWDNFPYWIAGEMAPGTETPHVHPYFQLDTTTVNAFTATQKAYWTYMNLPLVTPGGSGLIKISAIPHACMNLIWNEWYRAEQIIDPIDYSLADGSNAFGPFADMKRRAWERDYLTSALPNAQQGSPVDIPLGDVMLKPDLGITNIVRKTSDHSILVGNNWNLQDEAGGLIVQDPAGPTDHAIVLDPNTAWSVGATTINDLRLAWIVQKWQERNMRGGVRYPELLMNHFGIKAQDARLQRPEYLFGVTTPVKIGEVLNTTGTVSNPQGNMAGHGASVTNGGYEKYFCQEHGYFIVVMSLVPKPGYQQGVPKHYLTIDDPTDYPWPSFAHLGEEPVFNEEVYAWQGANNKEAFGYMPRYSWMKYMNDRVAGDFQTTLDFWHWNRIFSSAPVLNQAFIECNPDTRIFAVEDGTDNIYADVYFDMKVLSRLPKYSTPR